MSELTPSPYNNNKQPLPPDVLGQYIGDVAMNNALAESQGSATEAEKQDTLRPTQAMREVSPQRDELRKAHEAGMRAAALRRANPPKQPEAWAPDIPIGNRYGYRRLTMEEMPHIASPIVEMIREEMPEVVMVVDRGGRFLGDAVWNVWHQRYPGVRFPTIDYRMHFGRNSRDG